MHLMSFMIFSHIGLLNLKKSKKGCYLALSGFWTLAIIFKWAIRICSTSLFLTLSRQIARPQRLYIFQIVTQSMHLMSFKILPVLYFYIRRSQKKGGFWTVEHMHMQYALWVLGCCWDSRGSGSIAEKFPLDCLSHTSNHQFPRWFACAYIASLNGVL